MQRTAPPFDSSHLAAPYLVRRLRTLHESVARDLAKSFSTLLRGACTAGVTGVEQPAFGRFLGSVESPACLYLLKAEATGDRMLLDVEPALMHSMIDRLLGGSGNEPPPGRPMTEIEQCVAARVVRAFLRDYCLAWKGATDLRLDILRTESDPQLLRVLPPDEPTVSITFELVLGELHGRIRLCVPRRAIEQMAAGLLPSDPLAPPSDASLDVSVTLATTSITGHELNSLRPGDIIATETPAGSPAIISIAGQAKYRGKPGQYQGRKAAVILGELAMPEPNGQG